MEPGRPPGFVQAVAGLSDYLQLYVRRKAAFPDHPRFSPQRARRLLDLLGAPDQALVVIRVVGTKGKGSTAAMLAQVLQVAGRRVGLYTSPHLHSPRERIAVDGVPISRPAFAAGVRQVHELLIGSLQWGDLGPATLFEGLTALAMWHLARFGAEVAVVEAGMGGRSDATHALHPCLTLLTPIALDHQAYLGKTIAAIAAEKAGAIPPGGLALSAPQPADAWAVIQAHCRRVGATLVPSTALAEANLGLHGAHQGVNAGLVLAAVAALRERGWTIPDRALAEGLQELHWPGRLEVVAGRPLTVVDAAHNPTAAEALAAALAEFPSRPHILLLGCSADKDLPGIVAALAPRADGAVVTRARHHRAAAPEQLANLWREQQAVPVEVVPEVTAALKRARDWAGPAGLVCACGSFFVVAEVREALGMAVREPWPEPAGSDQLSAISDQQSAISGQRSAISNQQSAISVRRSERPDERW
jgi:dihydrofolate synthase/folylpolyglutamate synthase